MFIMTSKKLLYLRQSVQSSSELLIIVIEHEVKLCYPFLHDVKETDTCEAISPMFKRAVLLLNWRWKSKFIYSLTWRQIIFYLIEAKAEYASSNWWTYCDLKFKWWSGIINTSYTSFPEPTLNMLQCHSILPSKIKDFKKIQLCWEDVHCSQNSISWWTFPSCF